LDDSFVNFKAVYTLHFSFSKLGYTAIKRLTFLFCTLQSFVKYSLCTTAIATAGFRWMRWSPYWRTLASLVSLKTRSQRQPAAAAAAAAPPVRYRVIMLVW